MSAYPDSDPEEFADALEDVCGHTFDPDTDSDSEDWHKSTDVHETKSVPESSTTDHSCHTDFQASEHSDHFKEDEDDLRRKEEAQLSEEDLRRMKSESLLLKDHGNQLFKNSMYSEALQEYTEALKLCPISFPEERSVLFSNRAACHIKLNNSDSALTDCDKALSLQPKYIRCLQRRAELREDKDRLTEALKDYEDLLKLDPGNEKARWACMTLPDRIKKQQEEMKEKMIDQLKQLGNMVLKPFGLSTDNFKMQKNPDSEGYSINLVR